jgi:nucleoside-diphosphate-sugar epimerase
MRIAITGATGNVGTGVLERLVADEQVESIVAIARRAPDPIAPGRAGAGPDKVTWVERDVAEHDLLPHLDGADVLIHLAWLFQPTHRPTVTWQANAIGSARVFSAATEVGVKAIVHASSVGVYSPAPPTPGRRVPESWPTHGLATAAYSREKAYVERVLDAVEARRPDIRVVRLRPGFIFQRRAATEQRRLFLGPFLPNPLLRPGRLPVLPLPPGLRFQAVHTADVAEAYRLAALDGHARGAFNIAADPLIDGPVLADLLETRLVELSRPLVRAGLAAAWRAHLVPADPALLDLVLELPLLDTSRARHELGWTPRFTGLDALREAITGMAAGAGGDTPPLAPDSLSKRADELATGVGERP